MVKTCVICGAEFNSPPSAKKVTCSPECRSIRAAQAAKGSQRKWSAAAKRRRSEDPEIRRAMENLQKTGAAAAAALPEGQRGPQNRASKVWVLIAPDGQRIIVKNLLDWARNNYTLFEPDCNDPDAAAHRVASGFVCIASSMRGVKSRRRKASSYKGWGLAALPESKEGQDG